MFFERATLGVVGHKFGSWSLKGLGVAFEAFRAWKIVTEVLAHRRFSRIKLRLGNTTGVNRAVGAA